MYKVIFLFIFTFFSANFLYAQDASEILNKAFIKCQSNQSGHYKMSQKMKFPNQDTIINEYNCSFQKFTKDTVFSLKFTNQSISDGIIETEFRSDGFTFSKFNPKDSIADLISLKDLPEDFNQIRASCVLYSPLTDLNSYPLISKEQLNSPDIILERLDDIVVNGNKCFHIKLNNKIENNPLNPFQVLKSENHYWIRQNDFIPIQFSLENNMAMNSDTLNTYYLMSIEELEINKKYRNNFFSISQIPKYYKQKNYVQEKIKPLLDSGSKAPNWTLKSIYDEERSLADYKGKLILLDFFYKACFPCTKALPHLQKLYDQFKDFGLEVIGIDPFDKVDTKSTSVITNSVLKDSFGKKEVDLIEFLQKKGINYTILLGDQDVVKLYNISGYPTVYFIDKNGLIISSEVGFGEGVEKKYEEIIKKHLNPDK